MILETYREGGGEREGGKAEWEGGRDGRGGERKERMRARRGEDEGGGGRRGGREVIKIEN